VSCVQKRHLAPGESHSDAILRLVEMEAGKQA
jgi:hypothetical protein